MAPLCTIVGLLAASLLALGGSPARAAAAADNPDWPCVQRKVATLTAAQMWDGPAVDDLTQWLDNEEIGKLIAVLASRRVPLEQAAAAIAQLAAAQPLDRRARAAEIERQGAVLRQLRERAARDAAARAELAAAEERYAWDVRVFTERQQSLPLACEVPVLIEQRLFELGRAIRSHMND